MSGLIEGKASALMFPVSAADATGLRGVHRYASSTSNQSIALPTGMRSRFIRVMADGCDVRVSVSVGAHTLVYAQTAALGTGSTASGATIKSGGYLEGLVPSDCTHINFICSAGSEEVEIYCTEVPNLVKASS
jgi:hypothetical protein